MSDRIPHPRDYGAEERRRRLLLLAGAALLALAVVAHFLIRDDGEGDRDAYCAKLGDLHAINGLGKAVHDADQQQLDDLVAIAPSSIHPAWADLANADADRHPSVQQQQIDTAKRPAELMKISQDASDNCGLEVAP